MHALYDLSAHCSARCRRPVFPITQTVLVLRLERLNSQPYVRRTGRLGYLTRLGFSLWTEMSLFAPKYVILYIVYYITKQRLHI